MTHNKILIGIVEANFITNLLKAFTEILEIPPTITMDERNFYFQQPLRVSG